MHPCASKDQLHAEDMHVMQTSLFLPRKLWSQPDTLGGLQTAFCCTFDGWVQSPDAPNSDLGTSLCSENVSQVAARFPPAQVHGMCYMSDSKPGASLYLIDT